MAAMFAFSCVTSLCELSSLRGSGLVAILFCKVSSFRELSGCLSLVNGDLDSFNELKV